VELVLHDSQNAAPVSPLSLVKMLGEISAYGTNLHVNDLVPINATPTDQDCGEVFTNTRR
jgi:hypothetical protein